MIVLVIVAVILVLCAIRIRRNNRRLDDYYGQHPVTRTRRRNRHR
jgi:hypothetical protein